MDDQCSADDAQIDALPQASYVSQHDVRAIGVTVAAEAPVYDTAVAYAIADAVTCSSSLDDDDDMLNWLQYPADDLIDKGYCSDIFGELPLSDVIPETAVPFSTAHVATMNTSTEAEAAMALGFGRVAGLVKQPGLEAFTKVRTLLPPILTWSQMSASKLQHLTSSQVPNEKREDSSPSFHPSLSHKSPIRCDHVNLPPSRSSPLISQVNFPEFSRLAATKKAKGGTRIANRIQQESNHCTTEGNNRTDGSTGESATSAGDASAFVQRKSSQAGCSASHEPSSKPADVLAHKGGAEGQLQLDICQNSTTLLCSASSKDTVSPRDSVESTEVTVTTSSGGSGSLCWKMTPSNLKKDSREMDVSTDLQTDDAGESIDLKKPATGRCSTKRNRAAEVHNLSERRRRDRINEKMKALQELIPNSDKCDKASILDEAIEYVKLLQVQIQMMFLRSGMTIPGTIMPTEMQHLQMPEVTCSPHLGVGIGFWPNLTTTGHPTISLQSLAGTAHISGGPSYAVNARHQLQSSSVIDNCSGYKDHQQLQMTSQPLNMDVWNAYMMHQPHYRQVHQGNEQN